MNLCKVLTNRFFELYSTQQFSVLFFFCFFLALFAKFFHSHVFRLCRKFFKTNNCILFISA